MAPTVNATMVRIIAMTPPHKRNKTDLDIFLFACQWQQHEMKEEQKEQNHGRSLIR